MTSQHVDVPALPMRGRRAYPVAGSVRSVHRSLSEESKCTPGCTDLSSGVAVVRATREGLRLPHKPCLNSKTVVIGTIQFRSKVMVHSRWAVVASKWNKFSSIRRLGQTAGLVPGPKRLRSPCAGRAALSHSGSRQTIGDSSETFSRPLQRRSLPPPPGKSFAPATCDRIARAIRS